MKLRIHPTSLRRRSIACAIATIGAMAAGTARADLNLVPGMNPVQASAASLTQTVCPQMAGVSTSLTSPQLRLLDSCSKLVVTANAQQSSNGSTPGQGSFDLGLTESGLRDALQAVAPEEINGFSRARTTALAKPLGARLLALRKGASGGGLASTSNFDVGGRRVALADLLPAGSTGGGASADALSGGRWGGFLNGHYNWGKRDGSDIEDAFDFSDYGVTGGVDYRFSDALVAGVALNYSRTKADFERGLGDVKSDDWGANLYGSYHVGAFYVDGYLGYSRIDFDTARRIVVVSTTAVPGFDTTARGSTKANQYTASIGTGYDMAYGDVTVTPYARLNTLHMRTDGFTESEDVSGLGLSIEKRTLNSTISSIGVNATKAIGTGAGVISPFAGIEWNHEFSDKAGTIVARYANDPFNTRFEIPTAAGDRNYFTARAGLTGTFANGISAFVNLESTIALKQTHSYALTGGVRIEF